MKIKTFIPFSLPVTLHSRLAEEPFELLRGLHHSLPYPLPSFVAFSPNTVATLFADSISVFSCTIVTPSYSYPFSRKFDPP
jgi:hypothetical protein